MLSPTLQGVSLDTTNSPGRLWSLNISCDSCDDLLDVTELNAVHSHKPSSESRNVDELSEINDDQSFYTIL